MTIDGNNHDPTNLTESQPEPQPVSASVDRFDTHLVEWFAKRSVWSGTASELLAALKSAPAVGCNWLPESSSALVSWVESHQQDLRSLGLDVLPPSGYPRMMVIRACQVEGTRTDLPSERMPHLEIKEDAAKFPDANSPNSENVNADASDNLIAMLRTLAASESTPPSTMSKLAAAPAHLRTAFKKAWTKRQRAG